MTSQKYQITLKCFMKYETLFLQNSSKINVQKMRKWNTRNWLFDSMKSIKKNKTPGNDGLTKKFYKVSGMN